MTQQPPPFTKADLQRWKADMLLKRPVTRHTGDTIQGVNVASLDIAPTGNGMYILINTSLGEEVTILLNPVVAAALRDGITQCGKQVGWLADDGTPTVPDP